MKMLKNKNRPFRQQSALECVPNAPNPHTPHARVSPIVPSGEKDLEARLRKEVETMGGKCVKLTSQLHRGLPDRLCLMPYGLTFFVEVKSAGRKPTKLQLAVHRELRELGFQVFVVDSVPSLEKAVALMDRAVIAERIRREEFDL